jgi:hypothetical protein
MGATFDGEGAWGSSKVGRRSKPVQRSRGVPAAGFGFHGPEPGSA